MLPLVEDQNRAAPGLVRARDELQHQLALLQIPHRMPGGAKHCPERSLSLQCSREFDFLAGSSGLFNAQYDGKTLRRSFDNFLDRRAAHILSAFASDTALVLAHLDCNEKSNEIPAVQSLLGSLALTDSVVTVDAMHCQKKHSSKPPPDRKSTRLNSSHP